MHICPSWGTDVHLKDVVDSWVNCAKNLFCTIGKGSLLRQQIPHQALPAHAGQLHGGMGADAGVQLPAVGGVAPEHIHLGGVGVNQYVLLQAVQQAVVGKFAAPVKSGGAGGQHFGNQRGLGQCQGFGVGQL